MAMTGATDMGRGRLFVTVDHDPTSTPTDCPEGSFILVEGTNILFVKQDNGETTNVKTLEQKVPI